MIGKKWILCLIFLLALGLRTYNLGSVPWGFHNDEVDVGYVGKFLILHGRDPGGNFLPLAFDKFGDFRPTGLFYLVGISELIFGTSEFAVRFPVALFGALTVFALYLFVGRLWGDRRIAIIASLFLAILPWHIVLSRAGHEAVVGYFLIVLGFYFFLVFAKSRRGRDLILGCLLIFSAYFFYHGIRLLVPFLLISSLPFLKNKVVARVSLLFLLLTVLFLLLPIGRGRFSQVVFYKNPGVVKKLAELPYADKSNLTIARIFHNKPVVYSRELAANYLQYFSADFLFLKGGYPERYYVPEIGHVYIVFVPLLILGLWVIARKRGNYYLPLVWLALVPTVAVLTYEDIPSATRTSFMAIPLAMVAAVGAREVLAWRQALGFARETLLRLVVGLFLLVLFLEMAFFAHQYLTHQRLYKGILRDDGMREISLYIGRERENYDVVVAAYGTSLPFYFLFYNGIFGRDVVIRLADLSSDFAYKNVIFTRDRCPSHRFSDYKSAKVLYIQEPNCEAKAGEKVIERIYREDLTEAFRAIVR